MILGIRKEGGRWRGRVRGREIGAREVREWRDEGSGGGNTTMMTLWGEEEEDEEEKGQWRWRGRGKEGNQSCIFLMHITNDYNLSLITNKYLLMNIYQWICTHWQLMTNFLHLSIKFIDQFLVK